MKSVNTRRNLTRVQKVMVAYRETKKETNPNYAEYARRWGVTKQELYNAKFICEHRPEYENILFDGGQIEYREAKTGQVKKGSSLYPIKQSIEYAIKEVTEKGKFIENSGSPTIATAFDQLRSAIRFLPKELSSKELSNILKILSMEVENKGKESE